jgi:hypothetical protein
MTELKTPTAPASGKSSFNWPVLLAVAAFVLFVSGVWIHNYSVTHAADAPAAAASTTK